MSLQVKPDFKVVDESADWVVVDKPAPLIVHPANNKPEPTLLGGLENLYSFEMENGACLAIVTRLDRETSGLVLVAKHTEAARELGMIFERRQAEKEYLAIVNGWPDEDTWVQECRILRAGDVGESPIWVKQIVHESGKECITRFIVEKRFLRNERRFSLVRCFPETGRMHQIRVHLQASGFPIVGDKIYSGDGAEYIRWMAVGWNDELEEKLLLPRHALHAAKLSIPWEGKMITWKAGLSQDLVDFIEGREAVHDPSIVIWTRKS